jgi:hypothetical protein
LIHAVALVVYAAIVVVLVLESHWDPLSDSNSGWSTLAIVVASWLWFAGGVMWLLWLLNLIRWWLQRRRGLARRTLVFDSLLWLGPWLVLLLSWRRSRRLIVPGEAVRTDERTVIMTLADTREPSGRARTRP